MPSELDFCLSKATTFFFVRTEGLNEQSRIPRFVCPPRKELVRSRSPGSNRPSEVAFLRGEPNSASVLAPTDARETRARGLVDDRERFVDDLRRWASDKPRREPRSGVLGRRAARKW